MKREQEIRRRTALFFLIGVCLLGFAFFAPDPHGDGRLFQVVRQTSWHGPLDWEAAWCSVKIILLSLGLFLLIESCGTWLMKLGYVLMGVFVYLLHVVPFLGLLTGSYYLVKSLL